MKTEDWCEMVSYPNIFLIEYSRVLLPAKSFEMKTIFFSPLVFEYLWMEPAQRNMVFASWIQIRETGKANWHALELLPSLLANFIVWFIVLLVFFLNDSFREIRQKISAKSVLLLPLVMMLCDVGKWSRLRQITRKKRRVFVANNNTSSSNIDWVSRQRVEKFSHESVSRQQLNEPKAGKSRSRVRTSTS